MHIDICGKGQIYSGLMGFVSGAISGYDAAKKIGLNPWTGGLNKNQRAIWLAYKNGNITLQEAMNQLHPELVIESSCPDVTVTPGNSRATTYPIDPPTGRRSTNFVEISKKYNSVPSEIQFHKAGLTSGRRFLFTSYHELTHAKMFFNGDMHNFYKLLDMNYNTAFKTNLPKSYAYYQAGLKIFAERGVWSSMGKIRYKRK